jgi:hypothetical protein
VDVGLLAYQIVVIVEFIKIISISFILPICFLGSIVVLLVNFYDFASSRFANIPVNNTIERKETIIIKGGAYATKNKNKKKSRRS